MHWLLKPVVFLVVAVFLLAALLPSSVFAFGISPGGIREDRLVPGSVVTRTISLVQGNPEADLSMAVLIDSKDMKEWLSFEQGLEFVIPAGVQQFPFRITVTVPKNAEFGNYSAFVRLRQKSDSVEGAQGGTVRVVSGARIDINITVGDDVIEEFNVRSLTISDIKEKEPLQAVARIENTGNVPTGPSGASFELFDKFGSVRLAFSSIDAETIGEIPAFGEETVKFKFPIDLRIAPGQYRGHVKLLDESGKVIREVNTPFEVRERTFVDLVIDLAPYIGFALVIAVGLWWTRRRKKRAVTEVAQEATVVTEPDSSG